jgi:hypothetical protein
MRPARRAGRRRGCGRDLFQVGVDGCLCQVHHAGETFPVVVTGIGRVEWIIAGSWSHIPSRTVPVVTHPYWPLFDLRLSTLDLELRPMTEADQLAVSDLLPDDVELDPAAASYPVDERLGRRIVVHQTYWRAYGRWRPESWRLNFAVLAGGELIGA